ncbi:MAG: hypothetical protein ACRECR_03395, partial [Thermoplasmata archaeon]
MPRELSAAAIYRPATEMDGRRRAGPDEDDFTLSVAAGELLGRWVPWQGEIRIHRFGPMAPEELTGLALALGGSPSVPRVHPPTAEQFARVLREELEDPGPVPALLLASEPGAPTAVDDSWEGGAVALRVDGGPAGKLARDLSGPEAVPLGPDGSAIREAEAIASKAPGSSVRPEPYRPAEAYSADPPGLTDRRSEGAYVPRATYLANLPSRWRFAADRCPACGALTFPVKGSCRGCGRAEGLLRKELPTRGGVVEAVTTVRPGAQPTEFDWMVERRGAYDVMLLGIAPGVRVTVQGTDRPAGGFPRGSCADTALRRL